MENVITFSTKLSKPDTRSVFVYEDQDPVAVYSYDLSKFEYVRLKDEKTISALSIDDMKDSDNIQLQYIHHFFLDKKIHFLIATQTLDGLESCLYLFEPVRSTLRKMVLNKKLTGKIKNMFVSKQSEQEKEYYILTVGTLDSALYVIRFTKSEVEKNDTVESKLFKCALLRTDARSATAQEIIALKSKSTSPSDMLIVCGGANGTIDFFLMKGDHDITAEPSVEFQPHDAIELPSKCPIISLQQLKDNPEKEDHFVLAVGQQLLHPSRISRLLEPSMTIVQMKIKGLLCTDIVSKKFSIGTYILPVENNMVWSCLPDSKETQVTKTELDIIHCQFGDVSNVFTASLITPGDKVQHIHVDTDACWILTTGKLAKGTLKEKRSKKRQHEDSD